MGFHNERKMNSDIGLLRKCKKILEHFIKLNSSFLHIMNVTKLFLFKLTFHIPDLYNKSKKSSGNFHHNTFNTSNKL